LWQFIADPEAGTLDVMPIRAGEMHLNALGFLEPPPLSSLTLESLQFNGDIVEADIGLKHPFLGLTEFTGFDVCGIVITNGTMTGFNDSSIVIARNDDDTRIVNPDGYSPWWNPANFPENPETPIFGYIDGLLGTPDDLGNYNATVCGYKCFADELGPDDSIEILDLNKRCIFSAGQKNIRHYTIHIGDDGLLFNYAVDACWDFPEGQPPWEAPESFAVSANRPEAFFISVVETENDLYYVDDDNKGGILGLDVIVYDWQGPDTIASVGVEWPGLFPYQEETVPTETTDNTGTYHFELNGDNLTTAAPVEVFITCKDIVTHPNLGNIPSFWFAGGFDVSDELPIVKEERIVYCSDFGVSRDIFSIDPEGLTEPVRWTEQTDPAVWCEGPQLSPDGQFILYLRYSWSSFASELRRVDVTTNEDISLSGGMTNWYTYGSWRHDGLKIVYSYADSIFNNGELYIMDPDGSNKEPLQPTGLYPWAPVYSADDQYIIFQSFVNQEIHFYEVATGDVTQYTSNGTWNDDPVNSPDGTQVAWATHYGNSCRWIYISPLSSWYPPIKIINVSACCRSPAFSPNGYKIAFDHGSYGGSEIAVYDLNDDTWYNVTSNSWGDYMPDWGLMIIEN
jgi:hypothetical protein